MALSEFSIIQQVFQLQKIQRSDVDLGIGDDAALVKVPDGYQLAISTDTLISGLHFPSNMKPRDIGYRALAVNLSDMAAMGAEPAWVSLALTIPESNDVWLKAFSSGFFTLAEKYNVQLIGGDTTRGPLSITVQAFGFVPENQGITRSGAKIGDQIYVTETLGDAAAGLQCWQDGGEKHSWLKQRLARPKPQIEAGLALRNIATSAIDISDGLLADLGHILEASNVGARIALEQLPLSLALCETFDLKQAREWALAGGDDYQLCFTVPEDKKNQLDALAEIYQITKVGEIDEGPGLRCFSAEGVEYEVLDSGFEHF